MNKFAYQYQIYKYMTNHELEGFQIKDYTQ